MTDTIRRASSLQCNVCHRRVAGVQAGETCSRIWPDGQPCGGEYGQLRGRCTTCNGMLNETFPIEQRCSCKGGLQVPGPGEVAPSPDFRVARDIDVDGDGRETPRGWLVVHPAWSTSPFDNEACEGTVASFEAGEQDAAEWVARALNYRAAHEEDAS